MTFRLFVFFQSWRFACGACAVWLLLFSGLPALAPGMTAPRYDLGVAADGSLRVYAPGVLRPEEGTIELTVRLTKPTSEFGNTWEFLFVTECARSLGPGGISMLAAFVPPEPDKGITFLIRTARGSTYLNAPGFTVRAGDTMNLAFSWGRELRFYQNGVLRARTAWKGPLDVDLLSPFLTVERLSPYNTSQLRITTRERAAAELSADPAKPFSLDADTVLLADQDLARAELRSTRWHDESSPAFLVPVLRSEAQCFNEGEAVALPFLAVNYGRTPVTRTVTCVGNDADDAEVLRRDVVMTIPPGGSHTLLSLPLPELRAAGHYPLSVSIAGTPAATSYPLAVAVIGKNDPTLREGAFGKYYGQHHHAAWDASVWERMQVRSSRAWSGIFTFLWWSVEPVAGEFDFRKSDAYVQQCRAAGMEVLGVLGYPSRWAAVESADAIKKSSDLAIRPERWAIRDLEAWKRYIYTTVRRYKDEVTYWEIYNEVNFHPPAPAATYAGSTRDYLELLKAAYAEAKRANPAAQIVISGFSPVADRSMPTDLLALGAADHFDIFATHAYNGSFKGIDSDWANAFWRQRPQGVYWQTEQMWHTLADDSLRAFKTVEIYVDFLTNKCARFFNMGDDGIFFDRNTKSPRVDYCAIAGVQQNLRLCDTSEGAYEFPGSGAFSLRHHFRRTDGLYLSILGSLAARHAVTVSGEVTAAFDLFQRPVPLSREGGKVVLTQNNIVYVLSPRPLVIAGVVSVGGEAVKLRNGSFEQYYGDDAAGLAACQPLDWTLRDTKFDPKGSIVLTAAGRTGKCALRLHSSGQGSVYVFQEVALRAPGTYRLSAYFRAEAATGGIVPRLFVLDNNTGKVTNSSFAAAALIPGEFVRCDFSLTVSSVGAAPLAIGFGIAAGAGDLTLDDASFGLEGALASDSRITNLSILTAVTAADPAVIIGTVVGGAGTVGGKPLLVRAVGPSLAPFGVTNALADPRLELYAGAALLAGNSDWGGDGGLRSAFERVGAFAFVAADSRDAALHVDALAAGSYTVHAAGVGAPAGQLLVELYDGTPAPDWAPATTRLVNASVRKAITAGGLLTAGFTIAGTTSKEILLRAVGPALAAAPFNVAAAMADPKIELFRGAASIASNDNWGGGAELSATFTRSGAFALPTLSRDAALRLSLPPGAYTAQVTGVGGSAGVVLVEMYEALE